MTPFQILAGMAVVAYLIGGKKQVDKYPNRTNAGPHFTWDELIVSAGAPALAADFRALYPNGQWPKITDPALWRPGDSRLESLKTMASAFVLNNPVSIVMAQHINNLVEPLRQALGGQPLRIISGWRPPRLNVAVGGARLSGHLLGVATDIAANAEQRRIARQWAIDRQRAFGDIGYYKNYATFFHIGSVRGYNDGIIK